MAETPGGEEEAIDLVVAGAGGGLVAAIRAAQLGQSVLVVEASQHYARGNNTAMSTAMIPGVNTRYQRQAGITDETACFVEDIKAKSHGTASLALATALAEVSGRLVEWLADDVGLPIELTLDFDYPGHSRKRCHTVPGRSGATMLSHLIRAAKSSPTISWLNATRLTDVAVNAHGHVAEVTVAHHDDTTETIPCRNVLLATNGFGANRELVRRFLPEISSAAYHGSPESQGDALMVGAKLGAATAFMDAYQGHAALSVKAGTLAGWATVMHGAVLVNRDGERFGDETTGYSEFAARVLDQPGGDAFIILDTHIDLMCRAFQDYQDTTASGAVYWFDEVSTMAAHIGCSTEQLASTLAQSRSHATNNSSDVWARRSWNSALQFPLGVVHVKPALFHTQGGLTVDHHARVTSQTGDPIPGLFASGGAAMGISGHGADGYLAGNGLLPAMGLAFLAAECVASRREPRP